MSEQVSLVQTNESHTLVSDQQSFLPGFIFKISSWCSAFGGIVLTAMVLLISIEVILRFTLKQSIPGVIELVEIMLIIVLFSGMASVGLAKEHIRVDILINRFSKSAKLATIASADMVTMVVIGIITWQSLLQAIFLNESGYQTGLLKIPLWPFAISISVFTGIFFLAILITVIENVKALFSLGRINWLMLIPGIAVILIFIMTAYNPAILGFEIEPETFGIISLLVLGVLIFLGVYIGAAMAAVAIWGMSFMISPEAGLSLIAMTSQSVSSNYIWSVGPLFMLMGLLVANAGFSRDVYNTAYKWMGYSPGGLASATVGACGAFAAVVGDSLTGVVTMGTISLPEMKKYKYDIKLATGAICAGGTIGILIPPSLGFIIYGMIIEESIGKLFIAGIIPGILLTVLMMLSVYVRCRINPALGPRGPKTKISEKLLSIKDSLGIIILFFLVIGGIYSGVFTPNEAGAIGAFGALIIGLIMRRLNVAKIKDAVMGSIGLAAMIFFIFIYATAITQFLAITQLPVLLADYVAALNTPRYLTLIIILLTYLVLGCVMNALPVVILTLPIIFPTIQTLGFDPIWFGVLLVMMVEIGQITPPIGMSVFAMSSVAPDVPMYTIFKGVLPFWIIMVVVVALIIIFPQIALFLPNLMMG